MGRTEYGMGRKGYGVGRVYRDTGWDGTNGTRGGMGRYGTGRGMQWSCVVWYIAVNTGWDSMRDGRGHEIGKDGTGPHVRRGMGLNWMVFDGGDGTGLTQYVRPGWDGRN